MKLQYIVLVWSAFVAGTLATLIDRKPRMVCGGSYARITSVPELVSLRYKGEHVCGGAMISEDWVLTAAHCFVSDRKYKVHAGTSYRIGGGSVHKISQYIIHEHYVERAVDLPDYNDIAMIRVHPPFQLDCTRKPILLPKLGDLVPDGVPAIVSGWGLLGDGSSPNLIHRVNLDLFSRHHCERFYPDLMRGQICAVRLGGGAGACLGDSGGPLTAYGRLWGIVSYGSTVGGKFPGIYTDVTFYRDWIKEHTFI